MRDIRGAGIPLACYSEGTAYNPEREQVREMRLSGAETGKIAEQTGMPEEQVIAYCHELGLPTTGCCQLVPPPGAMKERLCPQCGRLIRQSGRGARRKFCSEDCKEEYWREHWRAVKEKNGRAAVCENCGREFIAINETKVQRRFCSRQCYFEFRYGLR